jgi:glutamate-1-semialdehyde 2,1-aminomutase
MTPSASPSAKLGRSITADSEQSLLQSADQTLPGGALGGYAIPRAVRFVASHGEGARLFDASGNSYIDYVMGAGAMILGHGNAEVTAALHNQVDRGTHFFSILNDTVIPLADEVIKAIPHAETVTFTSTGSEATAYAMRFARAFTGRDKILKFEGAYHGNHDYSLISSAPSRTANYPQGTPDTGGIPRVITDEVLVAPYNDLDAVRAIVQANEETLAAIIVEPIQRVISPQPGFLQGLRAIADEFGILLIFDEVVTGFRLAYGGAQEYYGVRADLAAYGKILGAGLALGAVAGRADVLEIGDPAKKGQPNFAYVNGTLHGNPLASAAGYAALTQLKAPGTYARLNGAADELRKALTERLKRHEIPAIITGEGSLWHLLFAPKAPRNHADVMASDMAALRKFDEALITRGIFVLPGVRRLVSLAHTQADFDATIDAFDRVCTSA